MMQRPPLLEVIRGGVDKQVAAPEAVEPPMPAEMPEPA